MPVERRTLQERVAWFREYGYVLVEGAVTEAYLEELRRTADRVCPQKETDRNLLARDPTFEAMIDGHRGMPVLEKLLGDDIQLLSMDLRTCPPGGGDMAWHVDHAFFTTSVSTINTALYLDDLTASNGALRVVPRSHHTPFSLTREELKAELPGEVQVQCRAGTMVIFSDCLWHRTGVNSTAAPRRGLFIYYGHFWHKPCSYPDQPEPFHRMSRCLTTPRRRQLLGLHREGSEYSHYE